MKKTDTAIRGKKGPKKAVFKPSPIDPHLWNLEECANYLQLQENTVRRMVREKSIPFTRIRGRRGLRFVPRLIERWAIDASMENYTPQEVARG